MHPASGICVLNWNSGDSLSLCLRTLLADQSPASIVVVDNASTDRSVDLVRANFPGIKVIVNTSNLGYAVGNNIGARYLLASGCELLTFVNPDVVLPSKSLDRLHETLLQNPRAGCVGGVPSVPSGKISTAARTRPSAIEKIAYYGPLHKFALVRRFCGQHFLDPETLGDGADVYGICGACVAFRADAFREIEGFDERTFLYEEEFIAAERLHARGWKVLISTEARYQHGHGLSTSKMPYQHRLHFIDSEQHLLSKYYGWSAPARAAVRVLRYVEWAVYALRWACTRRRSDLTC